jgi:hypothetical protein
MDRQEFIDDKGRHYEVLVGEGGQKIIVGPPEGLVDKLKLPEPFATRLHNALYDRHLFNYSAASKGNVLIGVLQETLLLDAQNLLQAFSEFENTGGTP